MTRPHRPFSRRVLLSQLAVIIITLALVTAAFSWVGAQTVTEVTETKALATARTLAIDPDVRAAATEVSATHEDPLDPEVVTAMVSITDDLRDRSGIDFAVITDDRGIRLTHPDRSNIGKHVSTSPDEALAGRENISHERGTLGETVRAKVPIYSSEDEKTVVGQVSVGIYASVLDADLRRELLILGSVAVLALAIGVVASLMLGRRLRRETLGIGPEELAEMARDQGAVLRGLDDGILAFSSTGELTLSNAMADELLAGAVPSTEATSAVPAEATSSVTVPAEIETMMAEAPEQGALRRRITLGDRILLATAVRVQRGGVAVGGVVTLRDETQMLTMARQLESVTAMAQALRTQRHEFANSLHTVLGLVDTGATDEARSYLSRILGAGPITAPVEDIDLVSDPYLRALIEAKATTAAEVGVALLVTPDSLTLGQVRDPEAVTLILGNLIDNAVRAAVRTAAPDEGRVTVELLSSGPELHAVVTDTGSGVDADDEERIFDEGFSTASGRGSDPEHVRPGEFDHEAGAEHGHGIGLALSRRVAHRHGGRVWLIDGHDPELGGASFGMLLPEALDQDDPDETGSTSTGPTDTGPTDTGTNHTDTTDKES
ncbi:MULTISPECIES: ATP-binding protein [unclassified Brevibacterium]|uniref:ATP-binding protein n=1 Tax=unclassified Brevibacterium TaxID=2614124 RepID=UPI001E4A9979|nr:MULTISPECIES: ATP-binding protein [unclassified Brevibacterium]MCD1285964.1 histidine kinase [Brevibacterium sp. CCUG 69071]MDK8435030.1 ATP-binding protein [Brevibacterium sp. H-BE7]